MELASNAIQQLDAYQAIWLMKPDSVDLVVTDPPYGQIDQAWDKEADWKLLAVAFNRVLRRTGQIFIFCKFPFAATIINEFKAYFQFRFDLVWVKHNGMFRNRTSPVPIHEHILCFSRRRVPVRDLTYRIDRIMTEGKPYKHKPSDRQFSGIKGSFRPIDKPAKPSNLRYPQSVLFEKSMAGLPHERLGHPTQKPKSILENLILSSSEEGDLVFDPFMGVWSTAAVATRLKRNFIGFEMDPEYCRIGNARLSAGAC